MRQDEAEQIEHRFERLQLPLVFVDASTLFLNRLAGITDPEQKRKIIGARLHRRLRGRGARSSGTFDFLGQGTLYPDVIESVSVDRPVARDQEPPQRRRPARADAFQAGRTAAASCSRTKCGASGSELGLDDEFVWRQPFPGPGPRGAHPRRGHAHPARPRSAAPITSSPRK